MNIQQRNTRFRVGLFLLMAVLLIVSAGSRTAWAGEKTKEAGKTGTLTLRLTYLKNGNAVKMEGGSVAIYFVAAMGGTDSGKTFDVSSGKCSSSPTAAAIAAMDSSELTKRNAELSAALEKECAGVEADAVQTIADGKVAFSGLKEGLYFLRQDETSDGNIAITPFLITIPDAAGSMDVTASPKGGPGKQEVVTVTPTATNTPNHKGKTTPGKPKSNNTGRTSTRVPGSNPSSPAVSSETRLPQTGQLWWPVPLLAAAGLVLLVLAGAGRRKEVAGAGHGEEIAGPGHGKEGNGR